MTPTPEQLHILDLLQTSKSNLQIRALAGTGKTSTLELIQSIAKPPVLCLAFNKRIAEEMTRRFKSTTSVRTFNGLGHRIWAKVVGKQLSLEPKKTQLHLKEYIKSLKKGEQKYAWDQYWQVIEGVSLAKSLGYCPASVFPNAKRLLNEYVFWESLDERPEPITKKIIDDLLFLSIKSAYEGFIDFNDQVYMPALFGGTFPQFPLVLVDEEQDLSPVNVEMLFRMRASRIVGVGDPWQSIYAFRGACQNGMQDQAAKFEMKLADLSVSFRCPEKVVEHARWRVPHFKWLKPGGKVSALAVLEYDVIDERSTIICRNNAPLFRTAFHLLSHGRSVAVAGSDIGPKLLGILRRLGDEGLSRHAVLGLIEDWRAERQGKGSATADDMADCLKVFAKYGETLGQAISYCEHLFEQDGTIKLLTGHKAKGLEWDKVYHLDPWLCKDNEQDNNLRYVITTRSADTLYEIDSANIRWE